MKREKFKKEYEKNKKESRELLKKNQERLEKKQEELEGMAKAIGFEPSGKCQIDRERDRATRKDVYLLGKDEDGVRYWLEAPTWDCGWYWGFGYVETYTGNSKPSTARDINSHSHIDSSFIGGDIDYYDESEKKLKKHDYVHNLYDCPTFKYTTFTKDEGWKLSELFKEFYHLKETASLFKEHGGAGVTTPPKPVEKLLNKPKLVEEINNVILPAIFKEIISILDPNFDGKKFDEYIQDQLEK